MRDKPWGSVLEWLADQTGLTVNSNYKPTGTFTFIAPQRSTQQYSLPQVIDVLNEALAGQKYILIRGERSFTIVPADERIDPAMLPRVRPEDLDQRGNTELVSVVWSLTALAADDAAAEVKKMMGPFGQVVPLERSNKLLVQDTAGNLKRIFRTLRDIDISTRDSHDFYSYVCEYAKAREAVRVIVELLGDPRELPRAVGSAPPFGGFGRGQPQPPATLAIAPRIRTYHIAADERTNTVLIRGPADTINVAKEILKRIDVPAKGRRVIDGGASFRSYSLPGNARAVAKTLQEIYQMSPSVRVTAISDQSVLVYAAPEEHLEIARQLTNFPRASNRSESTGSGTTIPESAEALFRRLDQNGDGVLNNDEMPGALRAEREKWDTDHNGLIDLNEFKAYFQARMAQFQTAHGDGGSRSDQPRKGSSGPARGPLLRTTRPQPAPLDEKLNRLLERLDRIEKRLDRLEKTSSAPTAGSVKLSAK
jgi:type II secretory pathway component GspD/PulD (secretin)